MSSRYSFLQPSPLNVEEIGCVPAVPVCLPVYALTDLQFQMILYVDGGDKALFEEIVMDTLTTVKAGVCADCTENEPTPAQPVQFDATWYKIETGEGSDPDVWIGVFTYDNAVPWGIEVGECFKICFYKYQSGGTGVATTFITCSNLCFQRIADPCYTSLFTYRCKENQFEFHYVIETEVSAVNFTNSIRLPVYLRNMQLPSEEKSYVKSNGVSVKLMERIEEEYDLIVDFVPKDWHQKIKVMLAHDTITIKNINETENITWPIVCKEKYEINWQEFPYMNAPAETKVRRSQELFRTNSNCN